MKEEYDELIALLETALPFEVYPTRDTVVQLRKKNKITLKTALQVTSLVNLMEGAGVCCGITGLEDLEGNDTGVIICSLTHLLVPTSNPFYKEILKYQKKRVKWLAK